MVQKGVMPQLEIDIESTYHDADVNCFNIIADIPGGDLKDEVVMIGAHFDSWHSGTGATDNAIGCGVMMEAMRILKSIGATPRRTIRIALWTGEEQGLLGSRAYVSEHFGKLQTPQRREEGGSVLEFKPEYEKFSTYFNLDNGAGKIRGIYLQGNEAARPIFRSWLSPFADMGASTVTAANTGGTDHQSFTGIGLPGFQFIQDPIEYDTRTHHSSMDVYERLIEDDAKQASVILATFAYHAAMRDEKIPRRALEGNPTMQPAATNAESSQGAK
jgi:Zn-dependent M28 family amino/carboxypeptidase